MAIDGDDYTAYGKLFHPQPVGEPWPDKAEKRITKLEANAIQTDARLNYLQTLVHRLLNVNATEEAE